MAIQATPVDPRRYFMGLGDTSGMEQGARLMGLGIAQRREQDQQAQAQEQAKADRQKKLQEASQVMATGDSDSIYQYMLMNPDVRNDIAQMQNF